MKVRYYAALIPFNQMANFAALMKALNEHFESDFVGCGTQNGVTGWALKSDGYGLPIETLKESGCSIEERKKTTLEDWKGGRINWKKNAF